MSGAGFSVAVRRSWPSCGRCGAVRLAAPLLAAVPRSIGGNAAEKLWVEEGYALEEGPRAPGGEWSPQLCRTQVRVSMLGGRPAVERLLQRPLGNHVVLLVRSGEKWALRLGMHACMLRQHCRLPACLQARMSAAPYTPLLPQLLNTPRLHPCLQRGHHKALLEEYHSQFGPGFKAD